MFYRYAAEYSTDYKEILNTLQEKTSKLIEKLEILSLNIHQPLQKARDLQKRLAKEIAKHLQDYTDFQWLSQSERSDLSNKFIQSLIEHGHKETIRDLTALTDETSPLNLPDRIGILALHEKSKPVIKDLITLTIDLHHSVHQLYANNTITDSTASSEKITSESMVKLFLMTHEILKTCSNCTRLSGKALHIKRYEKGQEHEYCLNKVDRQIEEITKPQYETRQMTKMISVVIAQEWMAKLSVLCYFPPAQENDRQEECADIIHTMNRWVTAKYNPSYHNQDMTDLLIKIAKLQHTLSHSIPPENPDENDIFVGGRGNPTSPPEYFKSKIFTSLHAILQDEEQKMGPVLDTAKQLQTEFQDKIISEKNQCMRTHASVIEHIKILQKKTVEEITVRYKRELQEKAEEKDQEIKELDINPETEQATQQNPLSGFVGIWQEKWKKNKIPQITKKYQKEEHAIHAKYQTELASEQTRLNEELVQIELDKKHDLALFLKMELLGEKIQKYAEIQLIARNRSFFISGCIGRLAENLKHEMTPSDQAINKLQKDYPFLWKTIQNINKKKAADLSQAIITDLLEYQASSRSIERDEMSDDEDQWIEHFNTILEAILTNNKSERPPTESLDRLLIFDTKDQHIISFLLHVLTQTQQGKHKESLMIKLVEKIKNPLASKLSTASPAMTEINRIKKYAASSKNLHDLEESIKSICIDLDTTYTKTSTKSAVHKTPLSSVIMSFCEQINDRPKDQIEPQKGQSHLTTDNLEEIEKRLQSLKPPSSKSLNKYNLKPFQSDAQYRENGICPGLSAETNNRLEKLLRTAKYQFTTLQPLNDSLYPFFYLNKTASSHKKLRTTDDIHYSEVLPLLNIRQLDSKTKEIKRFLINNLTDDLIYDLNMHYPSVAWKVDNIHTQLDEAIQAITQRIQTKPTHSTEKTNANNMDLLFRCRYLELLIILHEAMIEEVSNFQRKRHPIDSQLIRQLSTHASKFAICFEKHTNNNTLPASVLWQLIYTSPVFQPPIHGIGLLDNIIAQRLEATSDDITQEAFDLLSTNHPEAQEDNGDTNETTSSDNECSQDNPKNEQIASERHPIEHTNLLIKNFTGKDSEQELLKEFANKLTEFYSSMAFCNGKTEEIKECFRNIQATALHEQPDIRTAEFAGVLKKIDYYLGPLIELETYMETLDHVKKNMKNHLLTNITRRGVKNTINAQITRNQTGEMILIIREPMKYLIEGQPTMIVDPKTVMNSLPKDAFIQFDRTLSDRAIRKMIRSLSKDTIIRIPKDETQLRQKVFANAMKKEGKGEGEGEGERKITLCLKNPSDTTTLLVLLQYKPKNVEFLFENATIEPILNNDYMISLMNGRADSLGGAALEIFSQCKTITDIVAFLATGRVDPLYTEIRDSMITSSFIVPKRLESIANQLYQLFRKQESKPEEVNFSRLGICLEKTISTEESTFAKTLDPPKSTDMVWIPHDQSSSNIFSIIPQSVLQEQELQPGQDDKVCPSIDQRYDTNIKVYKSSRITNPLTRVAVPEPLQRAVGGKTKNQMVICYESAEETLSVYASRLTDDLTIETHVKNADSASPENRKLIEDVARIIQHAPPKLSKKEISLVRRLACEIKKKDSETCDLFYLWPILAELIDEDPQLETFATMKATMEAIHEQLTRAENLLAYATHKLNGWGEKACIMTAVECLTTVLKTANSESIKNRAKVLLLHALIFQDIVFEDEQVMFSSKVFNDETEQFEKAAREKILYYNEDLKAIDFKDPVKELRTLYDRGEMYAGILLVQIYLTNQFNHIKTTDNNHENEGAKILLNLVAKQKNNHLVELLYGICLRDGIGLNKQPWRGKSQLEKIDTNTSISQDLLSSDLLAYKLGTYSYEAMTSIMLEERETLSEEIAKNIHQHIRDGHLDLGIGGLFASYSIAARNAILQIGILFSIPNVCAQVRDKYQGTLKEIEKVVEDGHKVLASDSNFFLLLSHQKQINEKFMQRIVEITTQATSKHNASSQSFSR